MQSQWNFSQWQLIICWHLCDRWINHKFIEYENLLKLPKSTFETNFILRLARFSIFVHARSQSTETFHGFCYFLELFLIGLRCLSFARKKYSMRKAKHFVYFTFMIPETIQFCNAPKSPYQTRDSVSMETVNWPLVRTSLMLFTIFFYLPHLRISTILSNIHRNAATTGGGLNTTDKSTSTETREERK